jgi:hypothetical protein
VFSGTDVPLGKHEEGGAILSPRPKLIAANSPKVRGSFLLKFQLLLKSFAARALPHLISGRTRFIRDLVLRI